MACFVSTRNEAAVASAFRLSLPAYVFTVRGFYPVNQANWRVPTVPFAGFLGMAAGGCGTGALYDQFSFHLPAFGVGLAFNF